MAPLGELGQAAVDAAGSSSKMSILPLDSSAGFGAEVRGADLLHLSDADFEAIRQALYTHHVLVFKGQDDLSPAAQLELNCRFDPEAVDYGHNAEKLKKGVLQGDILSLPGYPAVKLLGHGDVRDHEGLELSHLRHPMHTTFHKDPIPDDVARSTGATRFYRWHMDAALYELNAPKVTTLLALEVPAGRTQTVHYDDGTGAELPVSLGTTAFVSGAKAFEALMPEQKAFALRTKVQYAAHPYIWIKQARAHPTGLIIETEGRELTRDELPEVDESKIMVLPMVWKNPVTGQPSLQIHGCCVQDLITDGVRMGDLKLVRKKVYEMMRPGIEPTRVYPHRWDRGDLVIFNNWGVWHSVVGTLTPEDVRVYHQCNLAASVRPLAFSQGEVDNLLESVKS